MFEKLNLICETLVKAYLKLKKKFIIMDHSTHSPDLEPSDFNVTAERCRKSNEWNYQKSELYAR